MKKITYSGQKNVIGPRLRTLRKAQGLTQNELAARMQIANINLDQAAISGIEHCNRIVTDYELACFARALHVSESDLLSDFHRTLETQNSTPASP